MPSPFPMNSISFILKPGNTEWVSEQWRRQQFREVVWGIRMLTVPLYSLKCKLPSIWSRMLWKTGSIQSPLNTIKLEIESLQSKLVILMDITNHLRTQMIFLTKTIEQITGLPTMSYLPSTSIMQLWATTTPKSWARPCWETEAYALSDCTWNFTAVQADLEGAGVVLTSPCYEPWVYTLSHMSSTSSIARRWQRSPHMKNLSLTASYNVVDPGYYSNVPICMWLVPNVQSCTVSLVKVIPHIAYTQKISIGIDQKPATEFSCIWMHSLSKQYHSQSGWLAIAQFQPLRDFGQIPFGLISRLRASIYIPANHSRVIAGNASRLSGNDYKLYHKCNQTKAIETTSRTIKITGTAGNAFSGKTTLLLFRSWTNPVACST